MRLRSLALAASHLRGARRPVLGGGAVTLIGSGGTAPQPVLQAALRHPTPSRSTTNVHFVYAADGGNGRGSKDVQNGHPACSPARAARRSPANEAGTNLHQDVARTGSLPSMSTRRNKLENITIPAGPTTILPRQSSPDWSQLPGSGSQRDDRPGRPRQQRRRLQLLPAGGDEQRTAGPRTSNAAGPPTALVVNGGSSRTLPRSATRASPGRRRASRRVEGQRDQMRSERTSASNR